MEVLGADATITTPVAKGDLRLVGFDESVQVEDITRVVAEVGECEELALQVSPIRPMRNGLFMTWVKCPLAIAVKVAKCMKIRLGWTMARVELLEAKAIQCFRCWKFGHTKSVCQSATDMKGFCFRCGQNDHQVKVCQNEYSCHPCGEMGYGVNHRMGGNLCQAANSVRNRLVSRE